MEHFTILGPPRSKGRPRFANGRTFTDRKTVAYESLVAMSAREALGDLLLEGPVSVDLLIVLPRPKRLMRKRDPDGFMWAPVRPDADNVRKAVLDGMSAHWRDDKQVCAGGTRKVYAERTGQPRVEVTIRELGEYDG